MVWRNEKAGIEERFKVAEAKQRRCGRREKDDGILPFGRDGRCERFYWHCSRPVCQLR